jgi:hypothetical protein
MVLKEYEKARQSKLSGFFIFISKDYFLFELK